MTLTRYIYQGPRSATTLRVGDKAELLEVALIPGKPCQLPAEHEYTRVLLARKHLVPLPEEVSAAVAPTDKKGGKA